MYLLLLLTFCYAIVVDVEALLYLLLLSLLLLLLPKQLLWLWADSVRWKSTPTNLSKTFFQDYPKEVVRETTICLETPHHQGAVWPDFLNILFDDKFSFKSSPKNWRLFWLFWKTSMQLFSLSSGHTERSQLVVGKFTVGPDGMTICSIFDNLQQWQFAQKHKFVYQSRSKNLPSTK